jgi:hypothetical protein
LRQQIDHPGTNLDEEIKTSGKRIGILDIQFEVR